MTEPTSQCPAQPTPAQPPQPNRILATPATVAACQQDYADAQDVRDRLDDQLRGGR